ncbi:MAG TPA: TerB family tellurite resistance protein [Cyclobacteriaceae bacterium]|nr:TerB family tellurite resistance protein [Cyclobacteriaceae bacterium]HRJ80562.1 TerB family tellurite resistance protein [Cyclobacteriaceae bacterium]
MTTNYQLGLLHLVHLLISADGVVDENERTALKKIRERENIDNAIFEKFEHDITTKKERDIYKEGIDSLNACTDEEKLKALALLYKMSEVDGRVHAKEVRLLLYSIKLTGIEFEHVIAKASTLPSILLLLTCCAMFL